MTKTLLILIGPPGSGKSTLAKSYQEAQARQGIEVSIHSTDDQFMKDGKYCFDRNKLGAYHTNNLIMACKDMDHGVPIVIIDNTNVKARDYKGYVIAAKERGYTVELKKMDTDLDTCIARNAARTPDRKVPEDIVRRMWESVNALP